MAGTAPSLTALLPLESQSQSQPRRQGGPRGWPGGVDCAGVDGRWPASQPASSQPATALQQAVQQAPLGSMVATRLLLLRLALGSTSMAPDIPKPVAFWTFQEPTGSPRRSQPPALHSYQLTDGDTQHPVESARIAGPFGPRVLNFTASSPTQRLRAERQNVPALTSGLAGPGAEVSLIAWVQRPTGGWFHGFLAGVWGDADGARGAPHPPQNTRQYAVYFDLGACNGENGHGGVVYQHGLAAHISNSGGATPGHPFCVTAACGPQSLAPNAWHCVGNVYDGRDIRAYVNGTLANNSKVNPYPYPGGIYSPEAANRSSDGAEFGVGVSMSFGVNQFTGLLGGLVVFNRSLSQSQLAEVCDWPWRQPHGL